MYVKNVDFTLTSGKSDLTGTRSDVVALFADMRDFSNWFNSDSNLDHVAYIIKEQYERVIQVCNDYHHSFHKFLGDGFLLLWEADKEMDYTLCLKHAIDASFDIHKKYWYSKSEMPFNAPSGYGIGISMGTAIRVQPETFLKEMNEVDFIGYPLNCAARMQSLSASFGLTICSSTAAFINERQNEFLYPSIPAFKRVLLSPSQAALHKANAAGGLQEKDRADFRHLTWINSGNHLWKTDGLL